MENELKKLAAAMRDMSDMVGDHHWQAAKAIEELDGLKSKKAEPIILGDLDQRRRLDVARGEKLGADGLEVVGYVSAKPVDPDLDWQALWVRELPNGQTTIALDRLTDAQRLLSQLREELAQRDAEVSELKSERDEWRRLFDDAGQVAMRACEERGQAKREAANLQETRHALTMGNKQLRARIAELESKMETGK